MILFMCVTVHFKTGNLDKISKKWFLCSLILKDHTHLMGCLEVSEMQTNISHVSFIDGRERWWKISMIGGAKI